MKKLVLIVLLLLILTLSCTIYALYHHQDTEVIPPYSNLSIALACETKIEGQVNLRNASEHDCEQVILLSGRISFNSYQSLKVLLSSMSEHPKTLCFHSQGGSLQATLLISELVQNTELNTCLANYYLVQNKYRLSSLPNTDSTDLSNPDFYGAEYLRVGENNKVICASACGFLLMSGSSRYALGEKNIQIGLHHPGGSFPLCLCFYQKVISFNSWRFDQQNNEYKRIIASLNEQNKDGFWRFYQRSLKTHHAEMEIVGLDYLRATAVLNDFR